MKKQLLQTALTAAAGVVAALALAAPNMQEGEWENEIQMKMDVPGMPFAMPAMSFKHSDCITQKDMVPHTAQKGEQCEVLDHKMSGNKLTWKQRCQSKDGVFESTGEITYSGTTYQGVMHGRSVPRDKDAQSMKVEYKLNGKRLGACKGKPAS